jgi:hypothetical protein
MEQYSTIVNNFLEEYQKQLEIFQKQATEMFKEVFTNFWSSNPNVNVVVWQQYAPHFNDGDPCIFSVRDITFSNAIEENDIDDLNWGEYHGGTENIWAIDDYSSSYSNIDESIEVDLESIKILSKLLNSEVMENPIKALFGEDCRVIATREGFTSEEYDHD